VGRGKGDVDLVVVSGVSGSGKTTALRALEDLGYFCIDNLPVPLLETFLRLARQHENIHQVAVAIDIRESTYYPNAGATVEEIRGRVHDMKILFLDSRDNKIITRFKETRRRHPLIAAGQAERITDAIARERQWLTPLRELATTVLDTTALNVHELKREVHRIFGELVAGHMPLQLMSFGFRHGVPQDADFVFDVRYLPNPYFVDELRPKSGLDSDVSDYVLSSKEAKRIIPHLKAILDDVLPLCEHEGRASVTIAIGCTGGRHRSVAIVEALKVYASKSRSDVSLVHRDCERWKL
jgi:UPF0042 nucleotide-binding protein